MLAVIGGSGVYDIGGLANKRWVKVESPSGAPSDELLLGELEASRWCFFPVTTGSSRGRTRPTRACASSACRDCLIPRDSMTAVMTKRARQRSRGLLTAGSVYQTPL